MAFPIGHFTFIFIAFRKIREGIPNAGILHRPFFGLSQPAAGRTADLENLALSPKNNQRILCVSIKTQSGGQPFFSV
jgi:hypothetical protein